MNSTPTGTERTSLSLRFIAIVMAFLSLYWLKPVLLPLIISLFLIAMAWPIASSLKRIFPKSISNILSCVILGLIISGFCYFGYYAVTDFVNELPQYEDQFIKLINSIRASMYRHGLPVPRSIDPEHVREMATPIIGLFYAMLGHVVLIIALVILGMPELMHWKDKLRNCLGDSDGGKWREAAVESANSFQKYMTVMTGIGIIAAILTGGFCIMIGLEFWLLWALLAFVMNFVPVLGAVVAIVPPVLTAAMQSPDADLVWMTFAGLGLIQFFMGNVIDPIFQGRFLSMSPVVILLSIAFWSLLWGVVGAFLAVPLTHIFMITCQQFAQTRAIACLLSDNAEQHPMK